MGAFNVCSKYRTAHQSCYLKEKVSQFPIFLSSFLSFFVKRERSSATGNARNEVGRGTRGGEREE